MDLFFPEFELHAVKNNSSTPVAKMDNFFIGKGMVLLISLVLIF